MHRKKSRSCFFLSSFLACTVLALSTGCASGGFQLTRQYAGFVNKQQILIRIILYILTGVVFAVTMLADLVIFNTMDFWEGRVSQGTYEFDKDGRTFQVHHEVLPLNSLKRSTIQIFGKSHVPLQVIVLQETLKGEIEMSVDGLVRARVRDIQSLPTVSIFDSKGTSVEEKVVLFDLSINSVALGARH
jgi:hypothetical protein